MGEVNLPKGWAITKLELLTTDISYGYTAPSSSEEIGPKLLRITDIQDNTVVWSDVPYCKIEEEKFEKYLLKKNDLVFARTGATVGKSFLIRTEPPKAVYASYLIRVRTASEELISLLSHFFNSQQYWQQITEFSSGIGQPNVNGTKLKGLAIPLPPLAEQKVITDKLDTLLAQVDAIKARLERIPEILKTFRQSTLTAAVSGKLTDEWRLKNKPSNIVMEHNINLPKLNQNEHYLESVEGWQWIRLGAVVSLINGDRGKNYPNKNEYVMDGIPFINTGHINSDGTLSDERMNFISEEKFDSLSGGKTKSTDLVYCLRGATMGKTSRVHYETGAIASSLVIIRPSDYIDRDFAYYFLISPPAKNLINEFDNGSAQPNLSAKSLSTYPLQLPPFKEQIEIVSRVEEMFKFASHAEAKAMIVLERINKITQSILDKAFRGELTADWRAANPDLISEEKGVEALLEKIKAEREAIERQPKPKRSAIKNKIGSRMSKQIIKVVEALKQAGEPLSGQQLLVAAGYPSDSSTEQLEQFFLDVRDALIIEESIVKLERGDDSQDWFALAKAQMNKTKN